MAGMPAPIASARFVGREAAFSRLATVLGGATEGRAGTLLVSGTAGIGVTRFLNEAARRIGDLADPTADGTANERAPFGRVGRLAFGLDVPDDVGERPALLHTLAEELAHLPIATEELQRLRSGLLDALSLAPSGIEPAAEEALADEPPLESQIIADHLQRNGLGGLANVARAKAREYFRDDPKEADGWVGQWRRAAHHLLHLTAGPEELRQAQEALAEDLNEENLQRLQAVLDRIRRESLDPGTG